MIFSNWLNISWSLFLKNRAYLSHPAERILLSCFQVVRKAKIKSYINKKKILSLTLERYLVTARRHLHFTVENK